MEIELLLPVVAGIASMLAGGVTGVVKVALRRFVRPKESSADSFSEKLASLTTNLTKSTQQVDAILAELARVAAEREAAVASLETNLKELEGREKDLQERIEHLQQVPIPAVEIFAQLLAQLLEQGERRSAWRDYILFGAGVVVSTAISIGLNHWQGIVTFASQA